MPRNSPAFLLAIGVGFGLPAIAAGCATAYRHGDLVEIARESAIILWDARSKTQHFIRRARFTTDTADFGFLVPTPTQPYLAESSNAAFSLLEKITAPQIVTVRDYNFIPLPIGCAARRSPEAAAKVEVLDEGRVGGYDAVVLKADSAVALNDWLTKHEYATRPDLTAWLKPYVTDGWILTAFKIARDASRKDVATSAVRMSFSTEKPFFPYSEPAEQRDPKRDHAMRLLRVFLIAENPYEGQRKGDTGWPGKTVWAGTLPSEHVQGLTEKLGVPAGPQPLWLTTFEDDSSPRPGTADVFFVPSPKHAEVRRSPIVRHEEYDLGGWVCLGLMVLLLGGAVWGFWRLRRRLAAT
jgi:hypothetical protein